MKSKKKYRIFAAAYFGFAPGISLENTQIPGYDDLYQLYDFNRLRAELTLEHDQYPNLAATVIVDNETLYTKSPDTLTNKTTFYRAYLEYGGAKHFWVIGKQRIPLGVGKFWNPIDVFNPIDIRAIEPGERPGTTSIRYEYALSLLSNLDLNVAEDKGAIRIKGFLEFADMALVAVWDEEQDLDIIGWELEGELAGTGIELRSEGGLFHNSETGEYHTEFIVGAEYGFASSLVLTGEYHSIDMSHREEIGVSVSFQPAMLWTLSLITVTDIIDGSGFVSPVVEYSLSNEMTLSGGLFVFHGSETSIYGYNPDRVYMRWFIHF